MASSSSSVHNKSYLYDVFLSFSGEDTRKTFVDHLYDALVRQDIATFKDDERLQKGKRINDELLQSIEDSRCFIIVFSKNYASSSWCLNELLKIMECHKTNKHPIFPVFYDVEPSEVRKQTGPVGDAFAIHTNKNETEVGKWREALKEAADISGWDVRKTDNGHEAKVIKRVVEEVSLELRSINGGVDENLVGLEQRMQALDPYLEINANDVRMVGIKGMGGAGKTTLAQAIFDKLSTNFTGRSFVENVREKASRSGLEKLQEQVLRDVLQDKRITVSGVHEGRNLISRMLRRKKVLVVLDDVDHTDQLEALAGNWFRLGSRIIITTRDEQVLIAHRVKHIHDVTLLSDEEAIRLLCRHAFREDIPTKEYEIQSHEIVRYAAGLPLTIKVLGSFLCGKNKAEWIEALARLKTIPLQKTLEKLEISYESLEGDYKEIFLDVACFLREWKQDDAIRLLESRGFYARIGLRVLEKKSLLTLKDSEVQMHDHLVEMGKNIVRRKHPEEPNKHSRLWIQEEIEDVLVDKSGSEATRCIDLKITRGIFLEGLRNMKNLRCLIVKNNWTIDETRWYLPNSLQYLNWHGCPHWCLPETFEANNLVALEMSKSTIKQLWKGGKVMKKLKFLNLSETKLRSLDLQLTPILQRLNLSGCLDLVTLDVHGGCLKSLVDLNLKGCKSLKSISFIKQMKSLEVLNIGALNLRNFPEYIITGHSSNSMLELHLSFNKIEEVPSSIGNLRNLVSLHLSNCNTIKSVPGSICSLIHLRNLHLDFTSIEELPKDLGKLECLEFLNLTGINVKHLPDSVCMLKHLKTLWLLFCMRLEKLPEDIGQLESLETLFLHNCPNLREIPNSFCKLKCLKVLLLGGCKRLQKLPDEFGNLKCLHSLDVSATGITDLPQSIHSLNGLKIKRTEPFALLEEEE